MERIRKSTDPRRSNELDEVSALIERWREQRQVRAAQLVRKIQALDLDRARAEVERDQLIDEISWARSYRLEQMESPLAELLADCEAENHVEAADAEHLRLAANTAAIGTTPPSFSHLSRFKRCLVRQFSRCIYFLARPITSHQRLFNGALASLASTLFFRLEGDRLALEELRHDVNQAQQASLRARLDLLDLEDRLHDFIDRAVQAERSAEELKKECGELRASIRRLASRGLPDASASSEAPSKPLLHDEYKSFEDRFRGAKSDIRNRLAVYIPILNGAGPPGTDSSILDLGTGRGEWLELAEDEGFRAVGVDHNRSMVEHCRQLNLRVIEGDILEVLQQQEDESYGTVTAFHLLEHLEFDVVQRVVRETARILKPGGLVILETPNPENVIVGGSSFYTDPTHERPLHPATLSFLVEQIGFIDVEILRPLEGRPYPAPPRLLDESQPLAADLNPYLEVIRKYLFSTWDYSVLCRKPAA